MSRRFDYDLFVIGAGSGGVRAARLTARSGRRVAIAEEYRVGGTCVIRGCVPKKFMVMASEVHHIAQIAESFGWSFGQMQFDWPAFRDKRDREVERLSGIYARNLDNAGAELIRSRAVLRGPHEIELLQAGRVVSAERILIATGGRPYLPADLPGIEHVITSEGAFDLPELPRRLLVVGGGFVAVEFAAIFAGMGVETTLVYRGEKLLRGFDEEVRDHLTAALANRGMRLKLRCTHEAVDKQASGLVSRLDNGQQIETDVVLFATGRRPHVDGLGLESAGVELTGDGAVRVDAWSKTSADNIWAIGDVTNRVNLTPVAIREAVAFHETVYCDNPQAFDHTNVASAVFSQPPVGAVGLNEGDARVCYPDGVDVYSTRFKPMRYAFSDKGESMLMKLVVATATQRVVGVHIVGPDAPEMIQLAGIAVKAGLTKAQWDATCAVHPTAAEELVTLTDKRPAMP